MTCGCVKMWWSSCPSLETEPWSDASRRHSSTYSNKCYLLLHVFGNRAPLNMSLSPDFSVSSACSLYETTLKLSMQGWVFFPWAKAKKAKDTVFCPFRWWCGAVMLYKHYFCQFLTDSNKIGQVDSWWAKECFHKIKTFPFCLEIAIRLVWVQFGVDI